jgi:hypothetical protein
VSKAARLGPCEDHQSLSLLSPTSVLLLIPSRIPHPAILLTMGSSRRPDDGVLQVDVPGFPKQDVGETR